MPRFKPKGSLERSALADLWKNTLSRIPTSFGRLAYLASLRDQNSGNYRHHGLVVMFGREESKGALRESHDRVFREWLVTPLAEKAADIGGYLDSLEEERIAVLSHWLKAGHIQGLFPDTASEAERALFTQELDLLIELLRNAGAVERRAPSSERLA